MFFFYVRFCLCVSVTVPQQLHGIFSVVAFVVCFFFVFFCCFFLFLFFLFFLLI